MLLVLLDHRVSQVHQEIQDSRDLLETQVHKVGVELLAIQDSLVLQDPKVSRVQLDLQGPQVS